MKFFIPLKVLISYFAIILLILVSGYLIFKENPHLFQNEDHLAEENRKLISLSNLVSQIYTVDNLGRVAIQSGEEKDFLNYEEENGKLLTSIDSVSVIASSGRQKILLDSLGLVLNQKVLNTSELLKIKNVKQQNIPEDQVIKEITRIEASMGKITLENFIRNPSELSERERKVAQEFVDYLNENVPKETKSSLSEKEIDSTLVASKKILENLKRVNETRNESQKNKEIELLRNDLVISQNLNQILTEIEDELHVKTLSSQKEKEVSQNKTISILTYTSIVGLIVLGFFLMAITNDFFKNLRHRKQLEAEKKKTEGILKSKEQLIATVSHDIKTPLNIIQGYGEMIRQSDISEKQSYYIENIKNATSYINQLVSDLLDYSKIEAGKVIVEYSDINIADLIEEIAQGVQAHYAKKDIELMLETKDIQGLVFKADVLKIRQILTNLIGNAYKFTDSGFVRIAVQSVKNGITISVADSGIGIKPEYHNSIFEEFTQADESIEKKYGGSGLGLTICKKLTEILGGSITLKSESGVGSIFTVYFPFQQVGQLDKADDFVPDFDESFRILVTDDDAAQLQLTAELLKQSNIKVVTASSVKESVSHLKNGSFDMILTDIQMPDQDGFDFMKIIKTDFPELKIPVIAVTGRRDLPESDYIDAGFSHIIQKPFSPKQLLLAVHRYAGENITHHVEEKTPDFPESEYFNLKTLGSFVNHDPDTLRDVLQVFVSNLEQDLKTLEDNFQEKKYKSLSETAHKMIPMLAQIEAKELAGLLRKIEQADLDNIDSKQTEEILHIIKEKSKFLVEDLQHKILF